MIIGADAIKTVVPFYCLISWIHPWPFEIHVWKRLGQMFKRGYLMLGATEDTGHIIQDLRQDPRFPLQHKGINLLLTNGNNPVPKAVYIIPWKIMASRSQASPCSRLQALCLFNFLVWTPSAGSNAGFWHLCANHSPQNCGQGGGDGVRLSNTCVVTALRLWENGVTFLSLLVGINFSSSHIPPTSVCAWTEY